MRINLLLAGLLVSCISQAKETNDYNVFSSQITDHFKITNVSPWRDIYRLSMRYMIMRYERNESDNTFCAIGYQLQDEHHQTQREAIVFWDKGGEVIRWQPEKFDLSDDTLKAVTMMYSPSISYKAILPRNDITPAMLSAYAREDVETIRTDCERNGEPIMIKAFRTPQACKNDKTPFDCVEKLLAL